MLLALSEEQKKPVLIQHRFFYENDLAKSLFR